MTKEEIFESLKHLKKSVIVHMYKTVHEDRDDLQIMYNITTRNLNNQIKRLEMALKMACENNEQTAKYFIEQAEKELKSEQQIEQT